MAPLFQVSRDRSGLGLVDLADVREHRGEFIALGVALMALGLAAIFLPFIASVVTTLALGWLVLLGGIGELVHALSNRGWAGFPWALASAVVYLVAGLLLIAFPLTGKVAVTLVLSLFLVIDGLLKVARALQHRGMPAWGWLVWDGVASVFLGVLIAVHWPSAATWALGLLVGIELVLNGSSVLLIGLGAGQRVRARM